MLRLDFEPHDPISIYPKIKTIHLECHCKPYFGEAISRQIERICICGDCFVR